MAQQDIWKYPFNPTNSLFSGGEGSRAFLAMTHMQAQACKSALRYQIEALDFLKMRFEKDLKLYDDLLESEEHGDGFDVFADFMREAGKDYAEEAGKMARLESEVASDTAEKIEKEVKAVEEDVATAAAAA